MYLIDQLKVLMLNTFVKFLYLLDLRLRIFRQLDDGEEFALGYFDEFFCFSVFYCENVFALGVVPFLFYVKDKLKAMRTVE